MPTSEIDKEHSPTALVRKQQFLESSTEAHHVLTFRANEQARRSSKLFVGKAIVPSSFLGRGLCDGKELWEQDLSACSSLFAFFTGGHGR